ncbi:MAG: LamG domain-containing protein, partial [Verrucomicrobiae bacterium]
MKTKRIVRSTLLLAAIASAFFTAGARGADGPSVSPAQATADLKQKWVKWLEPARGEFQRCNDRPSAEFIGKILQALDQPDGMSPAALAVHAESMKAKTRDLIRSGAMESAAILNLALNHVMFSPGRGLDGSAGKNPNPPGLPGPGGLVLYLPFDAPDKDGVIHDESGAGNDGKVFGATWVAAGRFGGAYRFNISNLKDRIVIPNSDSLNPENITLAAWINSSDTDGFWNRIIDKDWRKGYALSLGGDWVGKGARGKLIFEVNSKAVSSSRKAGDGQWRHVAATCDGQVMRIYLDGVEEKPSRKSQPGRVIKNNWDLYIGNSEVNLGTGEFVGYDGLIDDVRIYNRALPADEILALFNSQGGASAAQPAPAGLALPRW